ncbi:unnamed protein product [Didymodactylos carnosus]|uniref:J domain-containing protein n=1 Tax=Didymodactylos carnosus TaxID=1234261 RepID=A0A813UMX6_9BILA|nr:unnamed protein product [Didymodactylos carnosus]CAF3616022.1 unnamed protein product [Didymodactylos carnosus]
MAAAHSSEKETPYALFDLKSDATTQQLKIAYRQKIHDYKKNLITKEKFILICRAYETMVDPVKRKQYDETKQWTKQLPLKDCTLQQLACGDLDSLIIRLEKATIKEINAKDPSSGHTPLYCASRVGNLDIVQYLVMNGADPDKYQRTKSTALHVASFYGHLDCAEFLLKSGANYTIVNNFNSTAKEEASDKKIKSLISKLELEDPFVQCAANQIQWFLDGGLKSHHIDGQNDLRQTLLHVACKKGYFELVKWLIVEKHANLNIVDIHLHSPLHLASSNGYEHIVQFLLDHGADPQLYNKWGTTAQNEAINYPNIIELFDKMKERDMYQMAKDGHLYWFQYYFNKQHINTVDSTGTSLLYHACRQGYLDLVKWFIVNGADVNQQQTENTKSTPLHVAAFRTHLEIVEYLLINGANTNIRNTFGTTPADEQTTDEIRNLINK